MKLEKNACIFTIALSALINNIFLVNQGNPYACEIYINQGQSVFIITNKLTRKQ